MSMNAGALVSCLMLLTHGANRTDIVAHNRHAEHLKMCVRTVKGAGHRAVERFALGDEGLVGLEVPGLLAPDTKQKVRYEIYRSCITASK
jgi:hypothetical protein